MFERSQEIQEKIEEVRSLPVDETGHSAEKREAAKLLRMELMLDSAGFVIGAVGCLSENLYIQSDDLKHKLSLRTDIVHPEAANRFVDSILKARDGVLSYSDWVLREYVDLKSFYDRPEYAMYFSLLPQNLKEEYLHKPRPVFQGYAVFTIHYPLAVGLCLDENLYKNIDPKINAGGFFSANILIFKLEEGEILPIPVVVEKKSDSSREQKRVHEHEAGHAENVNIIAAMTTKKDTGEELRFLWMDLTADDYLEVKVFFEEYQRNKQDELIPEPLLNKSVKMLLGLDKDEILAEMKPENGNVRSHLNYLQTQEGLYDYIKNNLHLNPGNIAYEQIWNTYSVKLQELTQDAIDLYYFYQRNTEWNNRREKFRLVLAQLPVEEWSKQLNETLFIEEMETFISVRDGIDTCISRMREYGSRKLTSDEQLSLDRVAEFDKRFKTFVSDNSGMPILKNLKEFRNEFSGLEELVRETEIYAIGKRYDELMDEINSLGIRLRWGHDKDTSRFYSELENLNKQFNSDSQDENIDIIEALDKYEIKLKELQERIKQP